MKTPITDAEAQAITMDCDDSCLEVYVYKRGLPFAGELIDANVSRRLELDRAALMEACIMMDKCHGTTRWALQALSISERNAILAIRAALAAARANFPEQ